MVKHLAIINKEAAEAIFSGQKKIEGRFSQIKIAPYGKVSSGDVVMIKIPGESVVGQFTVDRVFYFDHPKHSEFEEIKQKYQVELAMPKSFWLEKEKVNFITLMFIKSVTKFIIAPSIPKKDLRPWVVLD